ncbi:hypothetical protein [Lysinibacillus sp. NPDC096212]|uniref:hypothetical protein n=1 Tax=Lysinibacillus sp. NPDC096212 TaxID=3364135 RepID=UPI00382EEEE6
MSGDKSTFLVGLIQGILVNLVGLVSQDIARLEMASDVVDMAAEDAVDMVVADMAAEDAVDMVVADMAAEDAVDMVVADMAAEDVVDMVVADMAAEDVVDMVVADVVAEDAVDMAAKVVSDMVMGLKMDMGYQKAW